MSSSVGSPPVSGSKVTRGPGRPRKAAKGPLSPAPVISDTTTEEKPSSEEEMKVKEIIDTPPQSKYSTRSKRKSKPEPSKTLPVATAVTKPEPPTILDMIREPSPPEGSSKQATTPPLPSSSEEDATEVIPSNRRYATRRVHSSGGSIIEQLTSSYSARREPLPPPPPPPLPPSSHGRKRLLSPKGSTGITSPRKQPTRFEKDSTKSVEKDSTKSDTSVEKHSAKSSKSLEKDSAKGSKVGAASSSATAARSPVKRGGKGRAVKASVASPGKLKTALRSSKRLGGRGQRSDECAEGVKSEILGETASSEDAPGDSSNEDLNQALSEDKSATDSNVVTKQETSHTAFHPPTKALDPSIAQASHTEPTNQPSTLTVSSSGEVSNLLKKDTPIEGDGGIMASTSGRRRDTAEAMSITLPESTATRGDVSTMESLDPPPESDLPGVSSIATSSERSSTPTQKAKGGSTILAPPQANVKTLSKDPPVSGGKKETIMATSPTAGSPGPSKSGPTDVELMEVVKEEEEGEGTSTSKAVGQVAQNSPELPTAAAAKTSVKETEPGNGEKESSNGEKESGNGEKVSGDDSAQPVEDKMSKEDTKEQAKGGVTEKSGISSKIVEQTTSKQVSASTSGPASASTSGQASGPAAGPAAGEGTSSSHPGASKKVSPPPLIPVQPGTYSSQGVVRSYF